MQIGDWMFWIGLPFSKVRSFLDTNVNWIWFNEDASNVGFIFLIVANMNWAFIGERI